MGRRCNLIAIALRVGFGRLALFVAIFVILVNFRYFGKFKLFAERRLLRRNFPTLGVFGSRCPTCSESWRAATAAPPLYSFSFPVELAAGMWRLPEASIIYLKRNHLPTLANQSAR